MNWPQFFAKSETWLNEETPFKFPAQKFEEFDNREPL